MTDRSRAGLRPPYFSLETTGKHILDAMTKAVDPGVLIHRAVKRRGDQLTINGAGINLPDYSRVHCLGAGKASAAMYLELLPMVQDRLAGGIVVAPPGAPDMPGPVSLLTADHPVPGRRSLAATRRLLLYVEERIGPGDLVLFLLSGGASALLAAPRSRVPAHKWQRLNRHLVSSGAPISDINCVRSALSRIKAGGLARAIYPAALWTLAISDVIGSHPETIGSGPTAPVSKNFNPAARKILQRHGLSSFLYLLDPATPTLRPGPLPSGRFAVIGDNRIALEAGCRAAAEAGFSAGILTSRLQGSADSAARRLARVMRRFLDPCTPRAWVFGGETTVKVKGRGKGGRNQELVLRLLTRVDNWPGSWYAACMGSDGIDGNSPAAGAWISYHAAARLKRRQKEMETALRENDSYRFFRRFGGLIETGPTGTNVMDLGVILLAPGGPASPNPGLVR
ncbi:MAG: DUF4147 domain-containing protein [Candidatus Aminicenantes bacterium]|nr:DUF4147 domain-containing protein [Candidatus Aminicenantes bacterium]